MFPLCLSDALYLFLKPGYIQPLTVLVSHPVENARKGKAKGLVQSFTPFIGTGDTAVDHTDPLFLQFLKKGFIQVPSSPFSHSPPGYIYGKLCAIPVRLSFSQTMGVGIT